ncbi:hypothetical protein HDV06_003948, partial [Boothiomyces sp. JEL0866]
MRFKSAGVSGDHSHSKSQTGKAQTSVAGRSQVSQMTTSLLKEGFLSMKPSVVSSAEMICVFMLGGAFHLTYFALAENKL